MDLPMESNSDKQFDSDIEMSEELLRTQISWEIDKSKVVATLADIMSPGNILEKVTLVVTRVYAQSYYCPSLPGYISSSSYNRVKMDEAKHMRLMRSPTTNNVRREMAPNIYTKPGDENCQLFFTSKSKFEAKVREKAEERIKQDALRLFKVMDAFPVQKLRVLEPSSGKPAIIVLQHFDIDTKLVENQYYHFNNLTVKSTKNELVLWSSVNTTVVSSDSMDASFAAELGTLSRVFTPISRMLSAEGSTVPYDEFDTVGQVAWIGEYTDGTGQNVTISDGKSSNLRIKFWRALEMNGLLDDLKLGAKVAIQDLLVRPPCLKKKAMVFYQDTTTIAKKPPEISHLFGPLQKLRHGDNWSAASKGKLGTANDKKEENQPSTSGGMTTPPVGNTKRRRLGLRLHQKTGNDNKPLMASSLASSKIKDQIPSKNITNYVDLAGSDFEKIFHVSQVQPAKQQRNKLLKRNDYLIATADAIPTANTDSKLGTMYEYKTASSLLQGPCRPKSTNLSSDDETNQAKSSKQLDYPLMQEFQTDSYEESKLTTYDETLNSVTGSKENQALTKQPLAGESKVTVSEDKLLDQYDEDSDKELLRVLDEEWKDIEIDYRESIVGQLLGSHDEEDENNKMHFCKLACESGESVISKRITKPQDSFTHEMPDALMFDDDEDEWLIRALNTTLESHSAGGIPKMVIGYSRLSKTQIKRVEEFCKQHGCLMVSTISESITHLIVCLENGFIPHTFKYFMAIAYHKWVVLYDWIEDSINAGNILPECNYESSKFGKCEAGAMVSRKAQGNLFDGIAFYLGTNIYITVGYKLSDLKHLLESLGAKFLDSLQNDQSNLIIIGSKNGNVQQYTDWWISKKWPTVTFDWVIECVTQYQIKEFESKHLCVKVEETDKQFLAKFLNNHSNNF